MARLTVTTPASPPGQPDDGRDGVQFVADGDAVGGLQCQVGAGAHRDRRAGRGHGGGVIDAVADDEHPVTAGLQTAYRLDLLLGQQRRTHVGDPGVLGHLSGRAPVVAGQQHRWRGGQSGQRRDGPRGVGTNLIGESEHTDRDAVHQHDGSSGAGLQDRRQLR